MFTATLDAATGLVGAVIAVAVYALVAESLADRYGRPRWIARNITYPPTRARDYLASAGVPVAVAITWGWAFTPAAALAAGAVTWLATLVWRTDTHCKKIPREPCWVTAGIGTALAFTTFPAGAVDFILALVVVSAVWVVSQVSRLGVGDVRFILALAPLSVFVTAPVFAAGIVVAGVIQIGYRLVVRANLNTPVPFAPSLTIGLIGGMTAALLWVA